MPELMSSILFIVLGDLLLLGIIVYFLVRYFDRRFKNDQKNRADAIVLGCAGMSDLCERLQKRAGMPVIDGVTAAVKLAEGLVGGGYRTSKAGAYDYPRLKNR